MAIIKLARFKQSDKLQPSGRRFKLLRLPYLPSSSTSAGAVPAFLASSSSFFFRQSSRDSFCADVAPDMVPALLLLVLLLCYALEVVSVFVWCQCKISVISDI